VQPARVVAGRDQQGTATLRADADQLQQARGGRGDQPTQLTVQRLDLRAQDLVTLGERTQRQLSRCRWRVELARLQHGRGTYQLGGRQAAQLLAQIFGGGDPSALSALIAWVRALTAVLRATRRQRSISTLASLDLGRPVASLACTARAAASASTGSDFP